MLKTKRNSLDLPNIAQRLLSPDIADEKDVVESEDTLPIVFIGFPLHHFIFYSQLSKNVRDANSKSVLLFLESNNNQISGHLLKR